MLLPYAACYFQYIYFVFKTFFLRKIQLYITITSI